MAECADTPTRTRLNDGGMFIYILIVIVIEIYFP
jgi:hypothetical protein